MKNELIDQIPKLFSQANLEKPKVITQIEKGVVNPCFDVDGQWVVRFNVRDQEIPKFEREECAYRLCRLAQIPSPEKVIYLHTVDGLEALIATKMPGEQIESVWKELDGKAQKELLANVAKHLKRIHGIELNSQFGELAFTAPKFNTWLKYLSYRLEHHFNQCLRDDLLPKSDFIELKKILNTHADILNEVKSPRLIHGDFHFGNILAIGSEVTAILDWEWSLAGDPLFDFMNRSNINGECKDGFEILMDAYGQTWPLKGNEKKRFDIYCLISSIEMIWVSSRYFSKQYEWGMKDFAQRKIDYRIKMDEFG